MKRSPSSLTSASLPTVASFECSNCGAIHQSRDAQAPVGWTQRPGAIWCADCTRQGIAARQIAAPAQRSADKLRLRGEVMELLRQGVALMPPGSIKRVQWTDQVNQLLAQQSRAA